MPLVSYGPRRITTMFFLFHVSLLFLPLSLLRRLTVDDWQLALASLHHAYLASMLNLLTILPILVAFCLGFHPIHPSIALNDNQGLSILYLHHSRTFYTARCILESQRLSGTLLIFFFVAEMRVLMARNLLWRAATISSEPRTLQALVSWSFAKRT